MRNMMLLSCLVLLLWTADPGRGGPLGGEGGTQGRLPPRDRWTGGEEIVLLPRLQRPLSRTYRKALPFNSEDDGYMMSEEKAEEDLANEVTPFESSRQRLLVVDPDIAAAQLLLRQSWGGEEEETSQETAESGPDGGGGRRRRVARSAIPTRTEYGRRASNLRGGRVLIVRGRNTRRTQYRRGAGGFKGG